MKIKTILLGLLLTACTFTLTAQNDARSVVAQNPNMTGGIFTSYHYDASEDAPAPAGYKPFYISHYGRHGSRWHAGEYVYTHVLGWLADAAEKDALTDLGKDVYQRVKVLAEDATGRIGQLTPKGRAEHRGIAERMYRNYPEVFSTKGKRECVVEVRSTLVPRCIMSMQSFCERLKELNPAIELHPDLGERYLTYLFNVKNLNASREKCWPLINKFKEEKMQPERFLEALFDKEYAESLNGNEVMWLMYRLACITQDVDYLNISLYDLFTEDELYDMWLCDNVERYLEFGPSAEFGDAIAADARPLLNQIITDADDAMATGKRSAFLRFGHDVNVVPLIDLLDVEGMNARFEYGDYDTLLDSWRDSDVTPMATNMQFVFYHSKRSDEILVKVLHNEAPCRLPLPRDLFPYYRWSDFRDYYLPLTEE